MKFLRMLKLQTAADSLEPGTSLEGEDLPAQNSLSKTKLNENVSLNDNRFYLMIRNMPLFVSVCLSSSLIEEAFCSFIAIYGKTRLVH